MTWYQVSHRFRMVARLPDGKTGVQALIEAEVRTLNPEEWSAFRKAGGGTYEEKP